MADTAVRTDAAAQNTATLIQEESKQSAKSNQATDAAPKSKLVSISAIMSLIDQVQGHLVMLGVQEGMVAETVSNSNTHLAENYKGEIEKFSGQSEVFSKLMIASSVFTTAAGSAGAGMGGVGMCNMTPTTATSAVEGVSQLGEAGTSIGTATMSTKKGETQANESYTSGALGLVNNESNVLVNDVNDTLDFEQSSKSAQRSLLKNENQASEYHG